MELEQEYKQVGLVGIMVLCQTFPTVWDPIYPSKQRHLHAGDSTNMNPETHTLLVFQNSGIAVCMGTCMMYVLCMQACVTIGLVIRLVRGNSYVGISRSTGRQVACKYSVLYPILAFLASKSFPIGFGIFFFFSFSGPRGFQECYVSMQPIRCAYMI